MHFPRRETLCITTQNHKNGRTMRDKVNFWQLDFQNETELANLKADLDASRKRLDTALFKHLALLAPVAIGGMGMFLRGSSSGSLGVTEIAMVVLPATVLVLSVFMSALSLALAPTNVVRTTDGKGRPRVLTQSEWIEELQAAVVRTNWHRGFEDNVEFYGFALAAIMFLIPGLLTLLG